MKMVDVYRFKFKDDSNDDSAETLGEALGITKEVLDTFVSHVLEIMRCTNYSFLKTIRELVEKAETKDSAFMFGCTYTTVKRHLEEELEQLKKIAQEFSRGD